MNDLVAMWKKFYGEEMIIKLPDRDEYALLIRASNGGLGFVFEYETLCPIDEAESGYSHNINYFTARDNMYTGDLCAMTPDKQIYSPDESVTYTITNNSGKVLEYLVGFLLEIKIEDQWYRVLGVPTAQKGRSPRDVPQGNTQFEFSTAELVGELSKSYRYNEDLGEYEKYPRWNEVSLDTYKLIPGQYRYTAALDDRDTDEKFILGFEFEIEG